MRKLLTIALGVFMYLGANAQITTFPYVENFDSESSCGTSCTTVCTLAGAFTNVSGDDKDWAVDASGTGSSNTGPSGDNTTPAGTGNYLYLEASSCFNKVAILESPTFDFTAVASPALDFYYHMYGQTMGSIAVEVSTDGGVTWSAPLWSISGQQQTASTDPYIKAEVSFCAYAGQSNFKFRIVGTTGSDFYSDAAIDDITVYDSPSCFAPAAATTANAAGISIDLSWSDVCGVSYDWEIVSQGSAQGTNVVRFGNVATNGVTANGLSPLTTYDLYVKTNCGGGSSAWAGPFSFFSGCTAPLSGSYTIGGATADYATIGAALTALGNCGVGGPVTFNIAAGTYNEQVVIPAYSGASATNTVTITGAGAASTTISYDGTGSTYSVVEFNGADYVTLSDVTIQHTGTANAWGIHFWNQADYNTVEDCIIDMDETSTASTLFGIVATNSQTSAFSYADNMNYGTIKNVTVDGGYYGIRLNGSGSTAPDNFNNTVEGCTITANYYGVYMFYQNGCIVTDNVVNPLLNSSSGYGFYIATSQSPVVTKNEALGARTYAFYLSTLNSTTMVGGPRPHFSNNMAVAIGSGDAYYFTGADSVDFYYNTGIADADQALWINSTSDAYDVRNNVLVSNSAAAIDLDAVPDADDILDYNLYYRMDGGNVADIVSSNYATLAAWQAADATVNANSVTGDPVFTSPTNLRLQGTVANDAGTPIAGVTDDIDGDARSATTPDLGADEYAPPSCVVPSALTVNGTTATDAILAWTAGGTETEWNIEWGAAGFTQGTGTVISGVTTNPYTLPGLSPNTTYEYYIQAVCSPSSSSSYTGPFAFTTACAAFTAPFAESFDNTTIPNCWSAYGSDAWLFTTTWPGFGASAAGDNTGNGGSFAGVDGSGSGATNDGTLESPLIDLSSLTTPRLNFFSFSNNTNFPGDNATLIVEVWDGATWTQELSYAGDNANWVNHLVDLSSYSGQIKVRFIVDQTTMTNSAFYNDIMIDDVTVEETPACPAPTGLAASNLSFTGAQINWTGTAANYSIEYGPAGFTPGTGAGTASTVAADSVVLSNLMGSTSYQIYVRAICGAGDTSAWSIPLSFFTGYCTPNPSSVDGSGIVNVAFGTVNNATGTEAGNYGDYTAQSSSHPAGLPFAIDITLATGFTYNMWAWVDWNQDLDFTDAGEAIYLGESTNANPTVFSSSITIPATATPGSYVLRIGGADSGLGTTAPSSPCYTGSWGSFEDYTLVVTSPPSCTPPQALAATATSTTTADLSWTSTASAFEVEYDLTGFTQGAGTVVQAGTNPYTLGSLTANTTYDYYVRAICGAGDTSTWSGPFTFTTPCNAVNTFPYFEGFENNGSISACWSREAGNGPATWTFGQQNQNGSVIPKTGNYMAVFYAGNYNAESDILVSPSFDFSSLGAAQVRFSYTMADWGGDQDTLRVWYKTSTGGTWTQLAQYAQSTTQWIDETLILPNPSSDYYIAFEGISGYGYGVTLDEVYVEQAIIDDAGVIATSANSCSNAEPVTIDIYNYGTTTLNTIPVSYSVNGGTAVSETWFGNLNPGDTATYTFTATFDASVAGNYQIATATALAGDMDATNDTDTLDVTTDPTFATTFSENFEAFSNPYWAATNNVVLGAGNSSTTTAISFNLWSLSTVGALVTPKVGPIAAGDELRFAYGYVDYGTLAATTLGAGDSLFIQVAEDCDPTFTTIASIHAGNHTPSTGLAKVSYDLSAYAGKSVTVRLVGVWANGDYYLDLDDFFIGEALSAGVTGMDISCNGQMDGSVMSAPMGGAAPYSYAWSTGDTTASVMGLGAGSYTVVVTDSMGYSTTDSVTVIEPAVLAASTTAVPDTNTTNVGSASVAATGGTMPFTYLWSNGATTPDLTGLGAGTYTVTVTDANGCMVSDSAVVGDIVNTTNIDYLSDLSIFPNPTRGDLTINMAFSQYADVQVSIFNVAGQEVQNLGNYNTTNETLNTDISILSEGVYFVRFVVDTHVITRRIVLIK